MVDLADPNAPATLGRSDKSTVLRVEPGHQKIAETDEEGRKQTDLPEYEVQDHQGREKSENAVRGLDLQVERVVKRHAPSSGEEDINKGHPASPNVALLDDRPQLFNARIARAIVESADERTLHTQARREGKMLLWGFEPQSKE